MFTVRLIVIADEGGGRIPDWSCKPAVSWQPAQRVCERWALRGVCQSIRKWRIQLGHSGFVNRDRPADF